MEMRLLLGESPVTESFVWANRKREGRYRRLLISQSHHEEPKTLLGASVVRLRLD